MSLKCEEASGNLEARADLARGEGPRRGDELHPQRHRPLPTVGQLQDRATCFGMKGNQIS